MESDPSIVANQRFILFELLHQLSFELNPDTILQKAVHAIFRLGTWHHIAISIPSEDGQYWQTRAADQLLSGEVGLLHPMSVGVIGRAYRSGGMQLVQDAHADLDYFRGETIGPVGSQLAMPIMFNGQMLGVLNIESEWRAAFKEDDLAFAQALSDMLGLALTNALRYTALKEERSEWKRLQSDIAACKEEVEKLQQQLAAATHT